MPASDAVALAKARTSRVSPGRSAPPLRHWYASVGLPAAVTRKVTASPGFTVWLAGPVVMEGVVRTVSTAPLVAEPAGLVTTTA